MCIDTSFCVAVMANHESTLVGFKPTYFDHYTTAPKCCRQQCELEGGGRSLCMQHQAAPSLSDVSLLSEDPRVCFCIALLFCIYISFSERLLLVACKKIREK